jgi:hypothetical protein
MLSSAGRRLRLSQGLARQQRQRHSAAKNVHSFRHSSSSSPSPLALGNHSYYSCLNHPSKNTRTTSNGKPLLVRALTAFHNRRHVGTTSEGTYNSNHSSAAGSSGIALDLMKAIQNSSSEDDNKDTTISNAGDGTDDEQEPKDIYPPVLDVNAVRRTQAKLLRQPLGTLLQQPPSQQSSSGEFDANNNSVDRNGADKDGGAENVQQATQDQEQEEQQLLTWQDAEECFLGYYQHLLNPDLKPIMVKEMEYLFGRMLQEHEHYLSTTPQTQQNDTAYHQEEDDFFNNNQDYNDGEGMDRDGSFHKTRPQGLTTKHINMVSKRSKKRIFYWRANSIFCCKAGVVHVLFRTVRSIYSLTVTVCHLSTAPYATIS